MPTVCPEKLAGSQKLNVFAFAHKKTGPKPCFYALNNDLFGN